jgi:hypothetical protein
MQLFDLIKAMFADPQGYAGTSWNDRAKNLFMVQRIMSIKQPQRAQMFNRVGVNPAAVVDQWQRSTRAMGRAPGWIFTKSIKKAETKSPTVDKEAAEAWMRHNGLGKRDLDVAMREDPKTMVDELKRISKSISGN